MEFSNIFPHLFAYVRLFPPRAASYIHGLSIEIPFRVTEIAVLFFVIYRLCVLPTILIKLHAHPECCLSSDAARPVNRWFISF